MYFSLRFFGGFILVFSFFLCSFFSFRKTAAAGFEEAKAKLGLVQSRSTELEKEAAALKKKASRVLD